jgi:hypothetical protein
MQHAVESSCARQCAPPFEVTPTQVMTFSNICFTGSSHYSIGAGLLPFSITPGDATSTASLALLIVDRDHTDAFDLGDDPENGAISPGGVRIIRNMAGYIPQSWTEARTQLRSVYGLLDALF